MRGEVNPLDLVIQGRVCVICNDGGICSGEWEFNPSNDILFHTKCVREQKAVLESASNDINL